MEDTSVHFDYGVVVVTVIEDAETAAQWIASALVSYGYAADSSLMSLRELDRFIDEHATGGQARHDGLLSKDLGRKLFAIGAYTGEVIRRISGGKRHGDDKDPQAEINVRLELQNGRAIWPIQGIINRFINGCDESLEHCAKAALDWLE